MQYNLKATGLTLTAEIRDFLEKRLAHAEKFLMGRSDIQWAVELQYAEGVAGAKYRAEYMLTVEGTLYRAEARGSTLHEAIDIATNELVRELTHAKKKQLHILRRQALRIKEYIRRWRE